jgi:guanylate kinase
MPGVILYGPPASGKDTTTAQLLLLHAAYRPYRPLKAGPGRTAGYRMTTATKIEHLDSAGELIWRQKRYGAEYAIDRPELARLLTARRVPIVHAGLAVAVALIKQAFPGQKWATAYLWCPRHEAGRRLAQRGTGDEYERMARWDATETLSSADLYVDTSTLAPDEAAIRVHRRVLALTTAWTSPSRERS